MLRSLLLIAIVALTLVSAVFVDEAFNVDWAFENLGRINSVEYDDDVLVVSSYSFTTGLNASTGDSIWRRPVRSEAAYLVKSKGIQAVSFVVADGNYVTSYDKLGSLEWEAYLESKAVAIQTLEDSVLVSREDGFVTKINSLFGTIGWTRELPSGVLVGTSSSGFVLNDGGFLKDARFDTSGIPSKKDIGAFNYIGLLGDSIVYSDESGAVYTSADGKTTLNAPVNIDLGRQLLIETAEDPQDTLLWRIGEGLVEDQSHEYDVVTFTAGDSGHLLVVSDTKVKLLSENGLEWARTIVSAKNVFLLDVEEKEVEAELLYEENAGVVQGFLDRVRRHLSKTGTFEKKFPSSFTSDTERFFSKVIVFVTDNDELFATDVKGAELWHVKSLKGPFTMSNNLIYSEDGFSIDAEGNTQAAFKTQVVEYGVDHDDEKVFGLAGYETWTYSIEGFKVEALAVRDPADISASIGVILPDRRVLYKYLHSGSVAAVLTNDEGVARVVILDKFTGRVLHEKEHQNIHSGTVELVFGEYWIVYSFETAIGPQLVVWDLFESLTPNERTFTTENYTSFEEFPLPEVMSQAFLTQHPITALGVSQTRFGITSRDVIVAFSNGEIVSVPKAILDTRTRSSADNVLLIDPNYVITHERQIYVEKIKSAGTLLESTSLIVGYGNDVFVTRSTPSQPFDRLTKSFSKTSLINTVIVLIGGVLALRPAVQQRALTAGWS